MDNKKTSDKMESSEVIWSLISNIITVVILCLECNQFLAVLIYDKPYDLYSQEIAIKKNSCCIVAYCIRKWNKALFQYGWIPDEKLVVNFFVKWIPGSWLSVMPCFCCLTLSMNFCILMLSFWLLSVQCANIKVWIKLQDQDRGLFLLLPLPSVDFNPDPSQVSQNIPCVHILYWNCIRAQDVVLHKNYKTTKLQRGAGSNMD